MEAVGSLEITMTVPLIRNYIKISYLKELSGKGNPARLVSRLQQRRRPRSASRVQSPAISQHRCRAHTQ